MTSWFSSKLREAISAMELTDIFSGPWKLKIAALGLAFLLWILVRLSSLSEGPVAVELGNTSDYATNLESKGNSTNSQMDR